MNEQQSIDPFEIPEFLQLTSAQRKEAWKRYDAKHGNRTEQLATSRYKPEVASCFECGRSYMYTGPDGDKSGRFCSDICRNAYDNGFPSLEARNDAAKNNTGRWKIIAGPPGITLDDFYGYKDEQQYVAADNVPYSLPMGKVGFKIKCANCNKEFDSKGLRYCSKACKRGVQVAQQSEQIEEKEYRRMIKPTRKSQQEPLADALSVSHRNIKQEGGRWAIVGRKGYVFADFDNWSVFISPDTERQWKAIKKKLSFMREISSVELRMSGLPTADQAAIVRKIVGLTKRPVLTEAEKQARVERLLKNGGNSKNAILSAA